MKRVVKIAASLLIIGVAATAAIFVLPVPRTFSFEITLPANSAINVCQHQDFRHGAFAAATVSFTWNSQSRTNFSVWDPSGNLAYLSDASSGSWSFSADWGLYDFCMIDANANSASVQGTAHETLA